MNQQTRPERIREQVEKDFSPQYVERVTQDMIDVASGNRPGNSFERSWLEQLFGERFPDA